MRILAISGQIQRNDWNACKSCDLAVPLRTAPHKPMHKYQRDHLRPPCTIRSKIMAQNRMEKPARMPCPTLAYCKASKTSSPRPFAPISEATTTMASDSMMVWLIPARMEGLASGRSTLVSKNHLLAPKLMAASRTLSGTPRSAEHRETHHGRATKNHGGDHGRGLSGPEKMQ